jgi:hypothetical protein
MLERRAGKHDEGMTDDWSVHGLYRGFFERAPEATVIVDDRGRAILANAAARTLSGVDVARFFQSPLAGEGALDELRAELRAAGRARREVRATTPRGPRWLAFEGRALGRYFVVVVRDTTVERAREIELNAMKAREAAREGRGGSRAAGTGRRVELNDAVLEARPLIVLVAGPSIEVTLALDPEAGAVALDPPCLEHILLNLTAALRASMRDGGTLCISSGNVPSRRGRRSVLHGFVTMAITTQCHADGSQLGEIDLRSARRAVQRCGGTLEVQTAPARATLLVDLPKPPAGDARRARG